MKRCLNCNTQFDGEDWDCPQCGYVPKSKADLAVFAPELAETNETYNADFFANLAALEEGHFWFEARNRLILWAARRYFPGVRKLLEIGCGTGFVLKHFEVHLPGVKLYGSDLLVEGLSFAANRIPRATLLQMDARDMPYAQEFDMIGAFDVIEHIEEDELVLSQMYNAVKPGGGILITVPQHRFLWSIVDDLSYHKRRYTRDELIEKVQCAGFEVLKTNSFVSLLLPLLLISRAGKPKQSVDFDLYAEFEFNPILNAIFSFVMSMEILLICAGVPFHAGGSRLIVARRPR